MPETEIRRSMKTTLLKGKVGLTQQLLKKQRAARY